MGAIVAFIFQALTLTVHVSEACHISQGSFCSVGFTTWAYWVSCGCLMFLSCGCNRICVKKGKRKIHHQLRKIHHLKLQQQQSLRVPAGASAKVPVAICSASASQSDVGRYDLNSFPSMMESQK